MTVKKEIAKSIIAKTKFEEIAEQFPLDVPCQHPDRNGRHEIYLISGLLICAACEKFQPEDFEPVL